MDPRLRLSYRRPATTVVGRTPGDVMWYLSRDSKSSPHPCFPQNLLALCCFPNGFNYRHATIATDYNVRLTRFPTTTLYWFGPGFAISFHLTRYGRFFPYYVFADFSSFFFLSSFSALLRALPLPVQRAVPRTVSRSSSSSRSTTSFGVAWFLPSRRGGDSDIAGTTHSRFQCDLRFRVLVILAQILRFLFIDA